MASCACVLGHFVSFTADIQSSPITRAYSLASPPNGKRFELCLNRVADGHLSPYLFDMQPGGTIRMTGPWGSFIFRQPVEDSVLVAAGTGIVPFRAMLKSQLEKDSSHRFTLILGVRYESGLIYRQEFEQLAREHPNFRFWPTLSRPVSPWTGRPGHVQPPMEDGTADRRGS